MLLPSKDGHHFPLPAVTAQASQLPSAKLGATEEALRAPEGTRLPCSALLGHLPLEAVTKPDAQAVQRPRTATSLRPASTADEAGKPPGHLPSHPARGDTDGSRGGPPERLTRTEASAGGGLRPHAGAPGLHLRPEPLPALSPLRLDRFCLNKEDRTKGGWSPHGGHGLWYSVALISTQGACPQGESACPDAQRRPLRTPGPHESRLVAARTGYRRTTHGLWVGPGLLSPHPWPRATMPCPLRACPGSSHATRHTGLSLTSEQGWGQVSVRPCLGDGS